MTFALHLFCTESINMLKLHLTKSLMALNIKLKTKMELILNELNCKLPLKMYFYGYSFF